MIAVIFEVDPLKTGHSARRKGRIASFAEHRIRVAEAIRDYSLRHRLRPPHDSRIALT